MQTVLSGARYLDANHNGKRDSGEVGLVAKVKVLGRAGAKVAVASHD